MDMARRRRVCGYKAMEFAAAINVPAWWVCGEICIGACLGWATLKAHLELLGLVVRSNS